MQQSEPLFGSKLVQPVDNRNLKLSSYMDAELFQTVPSKVDLTLKKKSPWRRMGNWTSANCTCAAAGHMIECWTANTTHEDIILTKEVMVAYIALSGYNPETGENDDGLLYSDILKYWQKIGIGGHKIKAYTTVNHDDRMMVRTAIYLFGGAYAGFSLPNYIVGKDLWEVMPGELTGEKARGSYGGHAVNVVGYDNDFVYCISWGKVKRLTWKFVETYCHIFYAIIAEDFMNAGKTPHGFDIKRLETDLMNISKAKKTLERDLDRLE